MADIDDLVAISQHAGRDVRLVQGGGGNTSVKSADGARMWIKASGLRLAQVEPGHGYLETDVAALTALLDDSALAALPRQAAHEAAVAQTQAATRGSGMLRPSLETTFHAVLGRLVLHTHPVYVNAFTCLVNGAEVLAENLPEPYVWVPYATPGYALGRAVAEALGDHRGQAGTTLVLANHGLITSGASAAETVTGTERLVRVGREYFGDLPVGACDHVAPPPALAEWAGELQAALERRYGAAAVRPATRRAVLAAADQPERWLLAGALVPDDVVYGGHYVWAADPRHSAEAWLDEAPAAWPEMGRLIVVLLGLGVVVAGPGDGFLEAMEENLLAHVLIRRLIARHGEAQSLPAEEVAYLLGMESEKYRQGVAAGQRSQ